MREVNFSIPSVNKASVGITTALYDRRALDCTSTLPLINSLNHLAYLTTSSARIRDILTVDGGIEKLVVILKEGRSKDLMSMWKWNLAFQCVVNIGVRGSETVRTRVVEADMVPVIATILDNYIQYMERVTKRVQGAQPRCRESRSSSFAIRRPQAPRNIEIPPPLPNNVTQGAQAYQQLLARHAPHPMNTDARQTFQIVRGPNGLPQPMLSIDFTITGDYTGIQPVRDSDRLLSMTQAGLPSQPASPTTPNPVVNTGGTYQERGTGVRSGRVALRHQRSMSGESDDGNGDELVNPPAPAVGENEPIVDIQSGVDMERDPMLESVEPMGIPLPHGEDTQDGVETFNITHRSPLDGSLVNPGGPVNPTIGFSPAQPNVNPALSINSTLQMNSRYTDDGAMANLPACMPRDEDVLMSLQLLAYVSKYCNLRTYFQKSHLVPRLSIDRELQMMDEKQHGHRQPRQKVEEVEEYLLPDDFNIFPLVEKFTVRHHPLDMQYWAGVVMRNLCRKDDSKGGIRQCAYYECGKWEEFTRQFAKCRRCRRTKYCSKECQKSAWVYHRHWCVAAQQ